MSVKSSSSRISHQRVREFPGVHHHNVPESRSMHPGLSFRDESAHNKRENKHIWAIPDHEHDGLRPLAVSLLGNPDYTPRIVLFDPKMHCEATAALKRVAAHWTGVIRARSADNLKAPASWPPGTLLALPLFHQIVRTLVVTCQQPQHSCDCSSG